MKVKCILLVVLLLLVACGAMAQTHVTQSECEGLFDGSGGSGLGGRGNNVDFINCITSAAGWGDNLNAQTGTTYTIVEEDAGRLVTFSNASTIAVTLPQAGTTGFEDGTWFVLKNIGAGTATVTPTTSTIDGSANRALTQNQWAFIWSDGSNYFSLPGGDHEHLAAWQVGVGFEATPSVGDHPVRMSVPYNCGSNIEVTTVRVHFDTRGSGSLTFQAYKCTNGTSETCVSMFSGGNQTYSNSGNVAQFFTTDQNDTSLGNTDFFKLNFATTNGQDNGHVTIQGQCQSF